MKQENARTKPASEKEVGGNVYGRKFRCEKCGAVRLILPEAIQFGEEIKCVADECDGIMCRAIL